LLDENGRPTLDALQLTQVYTYYRQAAASNLMPYWLTQYQTDPQSWQAFTEQQADLAITWSSRYLQAPPGDSSGAPIPTATGEAYTLATGWAWALASPDPERQALSAQLAEFLTTSAFLAEWSAAAGYLPPRPSALAAWQSSTLQNLMSQIAISAKLIPSQEVIATVGPILQKGTVDVLKAQEDPLLAAEAAAAQLTGP
jgi:ABC-type glycerol-3-phosphate transport system substrate-binding protein